jgi:hypothetical protein
MSVSPKGIRLPMTASAQLLSANFYLPTPFLKNGRRSSCITGEFRRIPGSFFYRPIGVGFCGFAWFCVSKKYFMKKRTPPRHRSATVSQTSRSEACVKSKAIHVPKTASASLLSANF